MNHLIASATHLDEICALVKYKLNEKNKKKVDKNLTPDEKRCMELLFLTSRSFAAVIEALDEELKMCICLFYLVLRGLDTIEDDMTIEVGYKTKLLSEFHNYIYQEGWTFTENGPNEKDRILLVEFDVVIREFLKLKPAYQNIICDITKKMAEGMVYYAVEDVHSEEDWDKYCHHVAGLVGIGLSQLFAASGLEDPKIGLDEKTANSMGLFLQKTNIIRDYLEDLNDGRVFWPSVVWKKYTKELKGFTEIENKQQALSCLNELVNNALQHVPDVYKYLSNLKNQSVFNFCAIPQVMAIATLARVYNNYGVFQGVEKIRKGHAVRLILQATSMDNVYKIFDEGILEIRSKKSNPSQDPTATPTDKILNGLSTLSPTYSGSLERSTKHLVFDSKTIIFLGISIAVYMVLRMV